MVLAMAPNALLLLAPECSSWTVVSRGTSLRTMINFWGDMSTEFVRKGNLMMSRSLWSCIFFKMVSPSWKTDCCLIETYSICGIWCWINNLILRMVLLLVLSLACRVIFVMEQPRSSDHIIANHHRFAWFCNHVCYVPWWRCEFINCMHGKPGFQA